MAKQCRLIDNDLIVNPRKSPFELEENEGSI